jgi:hypothetical protein
MEYKVIKSIISNNFLPVFDLIEDYEYYLIENNFFNKTKMNIESFIKNGFALNFSGSDKKELFEKNLKVEPENWYYRNNEVKYTLNSLGYRTKEFDQIDWKESIVMFGCSHVFGTGVTDEHTIPYFLEKLSGRPVINLGIGGSSIQTMCHNSIILSSILDIPPKGVIFCWTDLTRFNIYNNDYVYHMGNWSDKNNIKMFSDNENIIPFNLMNIKMIRNLWKDKTFYYEYTCFDQQKLINKLDKNIQCELFNYPTFPESSKYLARDLLHFGREMNMETAEKINQKINF